MGVYIYMKINLIALKVLILVCVEVSVGGGIEILHLKGICNQS